MSDNDAKVAQYESLRGEMLQNDRLVAQAGLLNFGAAAVIFGFGMGEQWEDFGALISLAPLIVIIPTQIFIASQFEASMRIATYLRIHVEPGLGISWEQDFDDLQRNKDERSTGIQYTRSLTLSLGLVGGFCIVMGLVRMLAAEFSFPVFFSYTIASIVAVFFLVKQSFEIHGAFHNSGKYETEWKDIVGPTGRQPKDDASSNCTPRA